MSIATDIIALHEMAHDPWESPGERAYRKKVALVLGKLYGLLAADRLFPQVSVTRDPPTRRKQDWKVVR